MSIAFLGVSVLGGGALVCARAEALTVTSAPTGRLMKLPNAAVTLGLLALLAGCGKQHDVSLPPGRAPGATAAIEVVADGWIGQWNGPEGTYLLISGGKGRYEITVKNLDGARTFTGTATGRGIEFERDGVRESLRATDGRGTGMKWLAEKSDCLVVRPGEGYCR